MSLLTDTDPLVAFRGAASALFTRAKSFWTWSILLQALGSLLGAVVVLVSSQVSPVLSLVVGALAIAAGLLRWCCEAIQQKAETLLRQIELEDGFGIPVDEKTLSDSLAKLVRDFETVEMRAAEQGSFFSSRMPKGPARALENLQESAWWSQQLATTMGWLSLVTVVALVLVTFMGLLSASAMLGDANVVTVWRLATATLSMVFAGILIRLPVSYFQFASAAENFDRHSTIALRSEVTEVSAHRLVSEYQLRRALAPMLADWLWKLRRKALNDIWSTRKRMLG